MPAVQAAAGPAGRPGAGPALLWGPAGRLLRAPADPAKVPPQLSREYEAFVETSWRADSGAAASPGPLSEPPPLLRLPTHLWQAKRFEMAPRWGWQLPWDFPGKGKG